MNSLAISVDTQFRSSPMNALAYCQNIERASQYPDFFANDTLMDVDVDVDVDVVALLQRYQRSKDVHITLGQVTATMDAGEEVVSMKLMWPSISPTWITRIWELCKCGDEDAALKEISLITTDFKSSGNLPQLATDFASLNFAQFPDIVLIGLLRNTYSVRAHIQSWDTLLDETEKILTDHKKNPHALLRGLKSRS